MDKKAVDEYLEKVDVKYMAAELEQGLKSKEVIERARVNLFQAEFAVEAIGQEITSFEEVKEVGFYPQERVLQAVLEIKQPFGYGGCPPSIGSFEYVGLFVDWNDDGDFGDTGEQVGIANCHVCDPGEANEKKLPILYTVTEIRDVAPVATVAPGAVVRVRAILSWQVPPTGPDFVPTFGNRIERFIRIDPIT
ncbi:MAG TPA: hypothetical protein VI338_07330 [Nitrososphaera sp.]|nr:hypothetical protein [Nitrososphaera sp.]